MVSITEAMTELGTGLGLFIRNISNNASIFIGFFIFMMFLFLFVAMVMFAVKRVKELT